MATKSGGKRRDDDLLTRGRFLPLFARPLIGDVTPRSR
jgi:hypothetical protein